MSKILNTQLSSGGRQTRNYLKEFNIPRNFGVHVSSGNILAIVNFVGRVGAPILPKHKRENVEWRAIKDAKPNS